MSRKDCTSNLEGLEQTSGTLSSETSPEHAPEPTSCSHQTVTPFGGDGTLDQSASTTTSDGDNHLSLIEDLDPHICKDWPCPKCHDPRRDTQEENVLVVEQRSALAVQPAAASARSAIYHSDSEPQNMELQSESEELQLEVATGAQAGQNQKKEQ